MGGGLALIAVVTIKLTPEMQGFYYTFYSLTILRFFAELGLTVAIIQNIAHLSSRPESKEKVQAYTRFFIGWFKISAGVLVLVLLPAIFLFHDKLKILENPWKDVVGPWVVLPLATGISVIQYGLTSIVEGHRRLINVSQIRLAVSVSNLFGSAILLFFDFGLWAISISAMLSVLAGLLLCLRDRDVLRVGRSSVVAVNWREEIWPFQWRLAISWAASFFIFYFITPFVMRWSGPVAAGQVGLSLQLFQTMSSVAVILISTNASVFGHYVARREFSRFGRLFWVGSGKSFLLLFLILISFWIAYFSLDWLSLSHIKNRLVCFDLLVSLTAGTIGTHLFFLYNYYLRSYKDESLWWLALLNSIVTVALCSFLVPTYGATAAILIFSFNSILFWGGGALIWVKLRVKSVQADGSINSSVSHEKKFQK